MVRPENPADVRMMGIVHAALKRDLRRVREVLDADPPPRGRQRVALGQHVAWMLEFLHAHHTSEDAGLWPLVLSRNPGAAELLASLEADHARIAPLADEAAAAAQRYAETTTDAECIALISALDQLNAVLFAHLDREVAEAMPVVATSITDRQWNAVEQEYNIKPKGTRQLAMEGHWLIEGIDPEGYEVVVHKVPPPLRLLLLYGFGPAYRRRARVRWTPDRSPSGQVAS